MTKDRIVINYENHNDPQENDRIFNELIEHATASVLLYLLEHGHRPYVANVKAAYPAALAEKYEDEFKNIGNVGACFECVTKSGEKMNEIYIIYIGEKSELVNHMKKLERDIKADYPQFTGIEYTAIGR